MRITFFGIYGHGLACLERVCAHGFHIVAVVTKPATETDRQPVGEWALSHGQPVLAPVSPREQPFIQKLAKLEPDLIVVAGYHLVIPKAILDIPRLGTINVHGSLLPQYRGPNPHKWVIMRGEAMTGVTVHLMSPRLDDGDILAQRTVLIQEDDTGGSLFDKLGATGAELLVETLSQLQTGTVKRVPQDEQAASYFGYPSELATQIRWERSAWEIDCLVRGLFPRPGAWTNFDSHKVRVWRVRESDQPSRAQPGTITAQAPEPLRVATATRDLILCDFSLDGQSPMASGELSQSLGLDCGRRFATSESA